MFPRSGSRGVPASATACGRRSTPPGSPPWRASRRIPWATSSTTRASSRTCGSHGIRHRGVARRRHGGRRGRHPGARRHAGRDGSAQKRAAWTSSTAPAPGSPPSSASSRAWWRRGTPSCSWARPATRRWSACSASPRTPSSWTRRRTGSASRAGSGWRSSARAPSRPGSSRSSPRCMVGRAHELKIVNTVCPVTIRRQQDTTELAAEVEHGRGRRRPQERQHQGADAPRGHRGQARDPDRERRGPRPTRHPSPAADWWASRAARPRPSRTWSRSPGGSTSWRVRRDAGACDAKLGRISRSPRSRSLPTAAPPWAARERPAGRRDGRRCRCGPVSPRRPRHGAQHAAIPARSPSKACPSSRWWAVPTWASRRSSTASSAAAGPSWRTVRGRRVTGCTAPRSGTTGGS